MDESFKQREAGDSEFNSNFQSLSQPKGLIISCL